MKASPFKYVRARSLPEAVDALSQHGDAKILAGGQSLIPALNLRLARPDCLIDINGIVGFSPIVQSGESITLGALVRHADVARSHVIASRVPLLGLAIQHVAHPAIRNRGTTCGSLAYADPASEMPACAVALDATLVLESSEGAREMSARDFYRGIYDTERRDDEILTEVRFPTVRDGDVFAFEEVTRRHGDFAIVGLAVRASCEGHVIRDLDLVVFGSESKPLLSAVARDLSKGNIWSADIIEAIATGVSGEMDPMGSPQGRPDTKRRQAAALIRRALKTLMENARGK